MTFVVLQINNAAPQSSPNQPSPVADKSLVNASGDDYIPTLKSRQNKLQIGAIAGNFGNNTPTNFHYLVSALRKKELSFERNFLWGFALTSNQMLEVKSQIDLSSLFLLDPSWDYIGFGLSQFIIGQDGFSNLVNINQTKFVLYFDLGPYFQAQAYYGLKGLAYSMSFQSWF